MMQNGAKEGLFTSHYNNRAFLKFKYTSSLMLWQFLFTVVLASLDQTKAKLGKWKLSYFVFGKNKYSFYCLDIWSAYEIQKSSSCSSTAWRKFIFLQTIVVWECENLQESVGLSVCLSVFMSVCVLFFFGQTGGASWWRVCYQLAYPI